MAYNIEHKYLRSLIALHFPEGASVDASWFEDLPQILHTPNIVYAQDLSWNVTYLPQG